MDCEKVRDRFSSLWEKELSSFEEEILKEHLSSCPECRKEFEQFEKTMGWLHSVEEVEVPEGFLPGLYKRREERKGAIPAEKSRGRWFHFPLSYKLPAQAVAMVAIVFLVLYLTRMVPMEGGRLKDATQTSSRLSVQEKPEQVSTPSAAPSPVTEGKLEKRRSGSTLSEPSPLGRGGEGVTQKEVEEKRKALETPRPKDVEQAQTPVPREGRLEEVSAPREKAEAKKREAPARSTEALGYQAVDSEEAARVRAPSPEPGKLRNELAVQEKSPVASKLPREIVLKISDRKKVIPRLHELVRKFGGDVVETEGDRLLASLPTGSFSEFEKELARFISSAKADQLIAKKDAAGSLGLEERAKRGEGDEKSKGSARLAADTGSRTIVRILLVEE